MMKKIGILGGLAWPSTVEYYAGICRLAEADHAATGSPGAARMPELAVESLDVVKAAALIGDDRDEASWGAFDRYHRAGLQRLERSGAEFAVIACNTAHHRFAQIVRGVAMPVLSIIDVAAGACVRHGVDHLLLLGTAQVMTSAVFRAAFLTHGIKASAPHGKRPLHAIACTIRTLQEGHLDDAAECIRHVVASTVVGRSKGSTAVYLGCTELPLAFPAMKRIGIFECDGVRYINSTALHVQAAFEHAMAGFPAIATEPGIVPTFGIAAGARANGAGRHAPEDVVPGFGIAGNRAG